MFRFDDNINTPYLYSGGYSSRTWGIFSTTEIFIYNPYLNYPMINTEHLEHAVKLALLSAYVDKERPVSMLLVAKPEHAKSEILKAFSSTKSVFYTSDFNTYYFSNFANQYLKGDKKTIVIPDFLKVVKKKLSTQQVSLTLLNSITEEGFTGQIQGGGWIDEPVIANVITAITEREMRDKRHKWAELGFLSRFVPLSYSYTEKTLDQIRDFIRQRNYRFDKTHKLEVPYQKVNVELPENIASQLQELTITIAKSNKLTGFRLQKQLQTLTMAEAVLNKRTMVIQSDLDVILELSKYINYDFTKI